MRLFFSAGGGRFHSYSATVLLALAAILLHGCVQPSPQQPPRTVAQLEAQQTKDANAYTVEAIVLYNTGRILDADLPVADRLASLAVLDKLNASDPQSSSQLASVLADSRCPEPLRLAVLTMLAKQDYPGLAPFVIRGISSTSDENLRSALLDWLTRHPAPEVLAEVVKLWAAETPTAENDERYSKLVQSVTGQSWSESLLNAINQDAFLARGSALELLARRLPQEELQKRVLSLKPVTPAVEAMQYYLRRFGYLPAQRSELLMAVVAFSSRREELTQAGVLSDAWMATSGYQFNIRDLHLLSGLQRDTVRRLPSRSEMIVSLAADLGSRPHTLVPASSGATGSIELKDNIARLTMADLANLYLLSEMLGRPRVQAALQVMAEKEQAETLGRWGGLIFYENGRAEARLYPSAALNGNATYAPSDRMIQDASNCLALLSARFDKDASVGPTKDEQELASRLNSYGLIISGIAPRAFTAVYYNSDGVAISIGDFQFPLDKLDTAKPPVAAASDKPKR